MLTSDFIDNFYYLVSGKTSCSSINYAVFVDSDKALAYLIRIEVTPLNFNYIKY